MTRIPTLTAAAARTLLLAGQGLLDDPTRRAGPAAVQKTVERLGFVQVDSIQRVERAHHLILGARLDGYRREHLDFAAFRRRGLFEHWTHDASLIPTGWFHHWKLRFARTEARLRKSRWFSGRLGTDPERTLERVYARIERDGPLCTSDFERPADRPATGWWDWTPEKAALEFLWHTGRLAIHGRDRFQKIYDLTERVFPEAHAWAAPDEAEHVDWACREALLRLGAATSGELAAFFAAVTAAQAGAWSRQAVARGDAVEVHVAVDGAKPRRALALPDWEQRLRRAAEPPDRIRLLAPFDPLVRDRERLLRLFGFDYRFEAFVPAARRRYGYYVLPILDGDRLVGRLDPRHDREREALVVEQVWWEEGVKPGRLRTRRLRHALEVLARQIGARTVDLSARTR